jgi:tellurite resistance protein TehA-like permease
VSVWLADKLVDTHALWNVVWASLAAGVGGTAAFSLAIVGATRFFDLRREGRGAEATIFMLVALAGVGLCIAAIVLGLYAILNK